MRDIQEPTIDTEDVVQPIAYGGTGANSGVTAAAKLKLVAAVHLDAANGVPKLDANGVTTSNVIPDLTGVQQVSIKGNRTIPRTVASTFEISDYDAKKTYTLGISSGTIVRNGRYITVTPPSVAGQITMTVNGRNITLTVVVSVPGKPTFYTPSFGGLNGNNPQLFYVSDYFVIGDSSTHASTDWQISLHPDFASIAAQSLNDATNKVSWTYSGLTAGTQYYVRCRFRDSGGNVGEWSNACPFRIRSLLGANLEEAIIYPADLVANQSIGVVSMSDDGKVCAVGGGNTQVAYIFRRNTRGWAMEAKLSSADTASGDVFGGFVSISGDGARLAITAVGATVSSVSQAGAVYIFTNTNGIWAQEAKLSAGDKVAGDCFGRSITIDASGTRIIVGADQWPNSNIGNVGKSYVFIRSGTTWTQEAKLVPSDGAGNDRFGAVVEISRDGLRVAVCSIFATVASKNGAGAVYIYSRSGTTWSQESKITNPGTVQSNAYFGSSLRFSLDHTRLAMGEYGFGSDTGANQTGRMTILIRSGVTWSSEAQFLAPNSGINGRFGLACAISQDGATLYAAETRFNNVVQGYVHIYKRSGSTWTFQKTLVGSIDNPTGNANFGASVSLAGNSAVMAVGASNGTTSNQGSAGRVYIFS